MRKSPKSRRRTTAFGWLTIAAVAAGHAIVHAQQSAPAQAPTATPARATRPVPGPFQGLGPGGGARVDPGQNQMSNPYRMVENWPTLNPGMKWGPAINFLPDHEGGTWALLRTEPPIVFFDAAGTITRSFADGTFVSAHGMCRDRAGNFWVGDSGPFGENPNAKAGPDTFVGPTACAVLANGDIIIADGHWPRPASAQQDGDRLVRYTADGKYVRDYGKLGRGAMEFMGPHALAIDSQGRLFVADRSNNRLQIFDKDMNFLDSWNHFGRPSGITILKDDTLVVADSESGILLPGPKESIEGAANAFRNVGWRQGIRIGSARDGSLRHFIDGTNPEGMSADETGTIFAGLTTGCSTSKSGGCVQRWIRK